jgi:hypothetical protein
MMQSLIELIQALSLSNLVVGGGVIWALVKIKCQIKEISLKLTSFDERLTSVEDKQKKREKENE